jgi:hypothetical protein
VASKRGEKRRRCQGKHKHSKEAAIREATRMRRAHPGESLDAYLCTSCGSWHVGHRPKEVRAAMLERRRRKQAQR